MKKTCTLLCLLLTAFCFFFSCTSVSSTEHELAVIPGVPPMICAAMADNYSAFVYFLDRYDGSEQNWISSEGMPVPVALGYFSLSNFKKACNLMAQKGYDLDESDYHNRSLISYLAAGCEVEKIRHLLQFSPDLLRRETVTNLIPIDFLQYAEYPFITDGIVTDEDMQRMDATRELLKKAGSPDITYTPFNLACYGNFVYAIANVLTTLDPFATPQDVNGPWFETRRQRGRDMVVFNTEVLPTLFYYHGHTVRVYVIREGFEEAMKKTEASENAFFLLADMGNSPFVTHNWVNINDPFAFDGAMRTSEPDLRTDPVKYRIQDIALLMAIEVEL